MFILMCDPRLGRLLGIDYVAPALVPCGAYILARSHVPSRTGTWRLDPLVAREAKQLLQVRGGGRA
jgi:hypothetical protein